MASNPSTDVTTLRKEGRLEEALLLGRQLLEESPDDPRARGDLGWVFYAFLKHYLKSEDYEKAKTIIADFEALNIPEGDELIHQRFSALREQIQNPELRMIQQAREASKQGNNITAHKLLWKAYNIAPERREVRESLGWEIYRNIKDELSKDKPTSYNIRKSLADYAKVAIKEPSLLHSCMLRAATRGHDKLVNYIAFVKWWDLCNLLPDDYEPFSPPDGSNPKPSLVENVIRALNQAAKTHNDATDFEWMTSFLMQHYQRYPEQEWFPYYLGKWLICADRTEEAREYILPIIRRKQTEYWAWDILAQVVEQDDPEQAIACLGRALLCRTEEKFLGNVRLHLAKLLVDQKKYSEARYEVDRVIKFKQEQEQRIPSYASEMTQSSWYASTQPSGDNQALYRSKSSHALDLLLDGIPWVDGIVMGHQQKKEGHPERYFIGIRTEMNIRNGPGFWVHCLS